MSVKTPQAPRPLRWQQRAADGRKSRDGHGAKTAAVREQAILALLSEPTIGQAAASCGIGDRTLHRWLTDDAAFQAEYEAARHATFQAAISPIPALTLRAVDTLADLLGDKEPPAVRLGAARNVADIGIHQYDAETILRKLDDLEASQRRGKRMRGLSLGSIRARVERPSACPTAPEPLFVHWVDRYERCPSCAVDLDAYAQATALAEAVADHAPGELPSKVVSYSTEELTTCPRCDATLRSAS